MACQAHEGGGRAYKVRPKVFFFFFFTNYTPTLPLLLADTSTHPPAHPFRLPHIKHEEHVPEDVFFVFGGSLTIPLTTFGYFFIYPHTPDRKNAPPRARSSCLATSPPCPSRPTAKTCPKGHVLAVGCLLTIPHGKHRKHAHGGVGTFWLLGVFSPSLTVSTENTPMGVCFLSLPSTPSTLHLLQPTQTRKTRPTGRVFRVRRHHHPTLHVKHKNMPLRKTRPHGRVFGARREGW